MREFPEGVQGSSLSLPPGKTMYNALHRARRKKGVFPSTHSFDLALDSEMLQAIRV